MVPSLIGLTSIERVEEVLKASILDLGKVNVHPSSEEYGTVLGQNPLPDTVVPLRSKVDITISLGTQPVSYTETMVFDIPRKSAPGPVNLKIIVIDVEGERIVYDQNEEQGESVTISFSWHGSQAIIRWLFDGNPELGGQKVVRP